MRNLVYSNQYGYILAFLITLLLMCYSYLLNNAMLAYHSAVLAKKYSTNQQLKQTIVQWRNSFINNNHNNLSGSIPLSNGIKIAYTSEKILTHNCWILPNQNNNQYVSLFAYRAVINKQLETQKISWIQLQSEKDCEFEKTIVYYP